jgi:hypothetical protein
MKNFNFKLGNAVVNFQFATSNTKTGALIQNYIIPAEWIESDAKISTLSDKAVCFDCPHSKEINKTCYVRKGQSEMGLASKVRSLRKLGLDNIPELSPAMEADLLQAIEGKGVRFGSYGEPILLGEALIGKISKRAKFWTGYTHQWHKNNWAKNYFMASVETETISNLAQKSGFRTFFVGETTDKNYVTCPASKEAGQKTTCDNCKLCMGTQSKAKSVTILPH